jgi:UDP-glucose 4-epimerase
MNSDQREMSRSPQSSALSTRLLITGGCGFIGKNFMDFMLKRGFTNFRILDNLSVGTIEDIESVISEHGAFEKNKVNSMITYTLSHEQSASNRIVIELQIGDIRNIDDCYRSTKNVKAVIHLAAQSGVPVSVENPLLDCEMNVIGTINMLEACRKNRVDEFIFASSGAPLGEVEPPIHEEKVPRPVSPYGASKLAGEAYCSAYYKTFGIKTVVLRFGNVYGPGSKHKTSVVAKFFKRAIEGFPLEIYGDGTQTRDFIFIEDLCNAIYLSLQSLGLSTQSSSLVTQSSLLSPINVAGEIFQIATFKETTVSEIAERIKSMIESENGKKVAFVHTEQRLGDVQRNYSDISKAMELLGFRPEYDLDRGLYETWKAFQHAGLPTEDMSKVKT